MQPPPPSPQIHEGAEQPGVQRDAPVRRERQRQGEVEPIQRIEQRRLQAAEERRSRENMRIPQRELALGQLAEAELATPKEVQRQVVVHLTDDARARQDQRLEEHCQHEQRKCAEPESQRLHSPWPTMRTSLATSRDKRTRALA